MFHYFCCRTFCTERGIPSFFSKRPNSRASDGVVSRGTCNNFNSTGFSTPPGLAPGNPARRNTSATNSGGPTLGATVLTGLVFATHGLPENITSDNGPPFQSKEFNDFMKMKGIIHHKVTPLWPQANGLMESFMKPLIKAVRTARLEGRDWRLALYPFLLNYLCTPHSTTGVSPGVSHRRLFAMESLPLTLQMTSTRNSTEKQLPSISSARLK